MRFVIARKVRGWGGGEGRSGGEYAGDSKGIGAGAEVETSARKLGRNYHVLNHPVRSAFPNTKLNMHFTSQLTSQYGSHKLQGTRKNSGSLSHRYIAGG